TVQNGVNSPITGVTRRHLSDDLYVEYFRAISANLYLTTGFSVSVPGAGIKSIVEDAPVWAGAYVNLIANYCTERDVHDPARTADQSPQPAGRRRRPGRGDADRRALGHGPVTRVVHHLHRRPHPDPRRRHADRGGRGRAQRRHRR